MPSRPFPDTGSRLVLLPTGRPAVGVRGYLYADVALTIPAEAYVSAGSGPGALLPLDEMGRRYITLDGFGRQPRYWGPASGQDQLWIIINGAVTRVDADYDPRLDTLEAGLSAVDTLQEALIDVLARLDAIEDGVVTPPDPDPDPEISGFSLDPGNSAVLIADTTSTGIALDGMVLTVDTILAAGVATDGNTLVVTI